MAGLGAVFERLGGELVDPVTVMPAALPLELSGEAVRARLCIFGDHRNRDLALRPDLTLPLAVEEVAARKSGRTGEHTVRYASRAFRIPVGADEPVEFVQVGCERFGYGSTPASDAELYSVVSAEATQAGITSGQARMGDLAIFPAFASALDLPPGSTAALLRAFREDGGVNALLSARSSDRTSVALRLKDVSPGHARTIVSEMLAMSGVELVGTRTLDEIVTRLVEQATEGDLSALSDGVRSLLAELTSLDSGLGSAADDLSRLARGHGLSGTDAAIGAIAERFGRIMEAAPEFLSGARFSVTFGRRFTYYDGFVFEIGHPMDPMKRAFGAGGRYDSLLMRLSAGAVNETAIGAVVRPDRIAKALEMSR